MPRGAETTTKFKVDISDLKKAMQEARREVALSNSEFKASTAGMDDWSKSADGISAKIKSLKTNLGAQKKVLAEYEKVLEEVKKEYGENSKQAIEYQTKLNNQKAVVAKTEAELKKLNGSLKDVGKTTKETSEGFTFMKAVLANLVAEGIKGAISGVAKLGKATADMIKTSVSAYADYEQLVGGIETLFGTGGQSLEEYAKSVGKTVDEVSDEYKKLQDNETAVIYNANEAYKTAGMTANQYIETVTGFSASLIQSLGGDTAKAVELSDKAIIDMSDNANKMGSDIESIKTAYAGFAKGQYTLLDNLKLGYGGTKTEMERLLKDASKLSGQKYDLDSYADLIEAIHVVQTEMGITGTTAKEASSTISGSIGMTKSAFDNFIAGLSNPDADMSQLIGNLIGSSKNVLKNVMPVAKTAVTGFVTALGELTPIIADELPALVSELVPSLVSAIGAIGSSLYTAFWSIFDTAIEMVGDMLPSALGGIVIGLPDLLERLFFRALDLVDYASTLLPTILENVAFLVAGLVDKLPLFIGNILESAVNLFTGLLSNFLDAIPTLQLIFEDLFSSIISVLPSVFNDLLFYLPRLLEYSLTQFVQEGIPFVLNTALTLFNTIVEALPLMAEMLAENLPTILNTVIDFIVNNIPFLLNTAINFFMAILNAIPPLVKALAKSLPSIVTTILNVFKTLPSKMKELGGNLIKGLWNGIKDMGKWIKDRLAEFCGGLVGNIKEFFGIHSPSKLMAKEVGQWLPKGIAVGIDDNAKSVIDSMRNMGAQAVGATASGFGVGGVGATTNSVVNNFTQNNYSPKALSRLELYRQSKNLLGYAGGI